MTVLDISDLGRYNRADLVKYLWDALDAEDHAARVKDALATELRARLGQSFEESSVSGKGRVLLVRWARYCTISDPQHLREESIAMGFHDRVFRANTAALAKTMSEEPAFAGAVAEDVVWHRQLNFQRQREAR